MRQLWRDAGRDTRLIMISYTLWGIGEGLWMFIQPLYVKSLGATPSQTGFVIGMWGLGRLLFILPAGVLADRLGARRVMLPGWYLGLTGVVMIALAPDWRWAAPGFLVYGASATAIPVTNLYLTQAARHDPTRRPDLPVAASLTLLWAAYSLGIVITPSIGGWIGDHVSLRAVFLLSVLWFMMSTVVATCTTPYPRPERPPRAYDYAGMMQQPGLRLAFLIITLGFVAVLVGQSLSSQYLEEVRGFSRTTIGVFGSLNALGTAVTSLLLGRLASWRGFYASLLLVLAAFGLLLLTGAWPGVAMAVFLLGAYYTARPLAASVIGERVDEARRGLAFALVDTLAGLATVIGTNSAGVLYDQDPDWPFLVGMAGIVALAAWGAVRARWPRRNPPSETAYKEVESLGK